MEHNIRDIKVKKLNIFPKLEGDVLHAIKKNDPFIKNFGEVYFSKIKYNFTKGWKRHLLMTLNLVVPIGNVNFFFVDLQGNKRSEIIGENNYVKLTVPPNIWVAFKGLEKPYSLIMNFADLEHDPNEVESLPINKINFPMDDLV